MAEVRIIKIMSIMEETKMDFSEIHKNQNQNKTIFKKLTNIISEEYFGVKKGFFKDKVCLDAGCGLNANGTVAMLKMGAKFVYRCDINKCVETYQPKQLAEFKGKTTAFKADILKLELTQGFDFVHCNGVLHHTKDVFKGLNQLHKSLVSGGYLYVMLIGRGGIMMDIMHSLRKRYITNSQFRKVIDTLTVKKFHSFLKYLSIPKWLVDEDLILTIKDRIQNDYIETPYEDLLKWFKDKGYTNIKRISRKPEYTNVRKYLAKCYYEYDSPYSKLLYGDGCIQIIAKKK